MKELISLFTEEVNNPKFTMYRNEYIFKKVEEYYQDNPVYQIASEYKVSDSLMDKLASIVLFISLGEIALLGRIHSKHNKSTRYTGKVCFDVATKLCSGLLEQVSSGDIALSCPLYVTNNMMSYFNKTHIFVFNVWDIVEHVQIPVTKGFVLRSPTETENIKDITQMLTILNFSHLIPMCRYFDYMGRTMGV